LIEKQKEKKEMQKNHRMYLKDILPLEQPLSLNIEATSACDLQCRYCIHSLPYDLQVQLGLAPYRMMGLETFDKLVYGARFRQPLKSVRFAGFGEPLLNPHLPYMMRKLKEEHICEKVLLFTNAHLLTKEKVDEMEEMGGVDSFQIDIQGLNQEDYRKHCNREINFEEIIDQIQYLSAHKKNAEVYIRTLRFEVKGREEEFYRIFSKWADYIAIDSTCSISDEIDYSDMITEEDRKTDEENVYSRYCPQPFFQLTINADGGVVACCGAVKREKNPLVVGNIHNETLSEIWNSEAMNVVRRQILTDKSVFSSCRECHIKDILSKYDVLDDVAAELKEKYE